MLTEYVTEGGNRVASSDESLMGVLRALGVEIASPGMARSLLENAQTAWRPIELILAHRSGSRALSTVVLPEGLDLDAVTLTLHRENGSSTSRTLSEVVASSHALDKGATRLQQHRFRLGSAFSFPVGYHRLELHGPRVTSSAQVIAAPKHCPMPDREWGVFSPLYALRSENDWGVGSFIALGDLGAFVAGLGASFIATLPLNATFLEGVLSDPSPYRPVSRLAWNELFIDVDAIPELSLVPTANDQRYRLEVEGELATLRRSALAEPSRVLLDKRLVLQELADAMHTRSFRRRPEFESFLRDRPDVAAYARFRAATERLLPDWQRWSSNDRALAETLDERDAAVRYHRYVQWIADSQLARASSTTGLYLDLPVGVHPLGFDPYHFQRVFAQHASGGAAPDIFQPAGQSWSVSPLHPERVREDGYRYVVSYLQHAMRHATMVRIDHVMGLHRLWWVPDQMSPAEGAYVEYHSEELRAIVVLEAARAGVGVVGEDLGTVAPSVRKAMRQDGMLRSHVHQFQAMPASPLPDPPNESAASLGSHDLPTFAAWWSGRDLDDYLKRGQITDAAAARLRAARAEIRQRLSMLSGDTVETALEVHLNHLARGPARVMMIDLEDLWSEAEPQNRPGSGTEYPNFRRRWDRRWPDDFQDPQSRVATILREVDRARRLPARAASDGGVATQDEADS